MPKHWFENLFTREYIKALQYGPLDPLLYERQETDEDREIKAGIEQKIDQINEEIRFATTRSKDRDLREELDLQFRKLEDLRIEISQRERTRREFGGLDQPWEVPEDQEGLAKSRETDIQVFTNELIRSAEKYKEEPLTDEEKADVTSVARAMAQRGSGQRFGAGRQSEQQWLRDWGKRNLTEFPVYTGVQVTTLGGIQVYYQPLEGIPGAIPALSEAELSLPDSITIDTKIREQEDFIDHILSQEPTMPPEQQAELLRNADDAITRLERQKGVPVEDGVISQDLNPGVNAVIRHILALEYYEDADSFTNEQVSRFYDIYVQRLALQDENDEMGSIDKTATLYAVYDEDLKDLDFPLVAGLEKNIQNIKNNPKFSFKDFRDDIYEGFEGENGNQVRGVTDAFEQEFNIITPVAYDQTVATTKSALIGAYQAMNLLPDVITRRIDVLIGNQANDIFRNAQYRSVVDGQMDNTLLFQNIQSSIEQQVAAIGPGGIQAAVQQELSKSYIASLGSRDQFESATGITLKVGRETKVEQDRLNEQAFDIFEEQIHQSKLRGEDPDIALIARQAMAQISRETAQLRMEDLPAATPEERERILAGQTPTVAGPTYQPIPEAAVTGPVGEDFLKSEARRQRVETQRERYKDDAIRRFVEQERAMTGEDITYEDAESLLFPSVETPPEQVQREPFPQTSAEFEASRVAMALSAEERAKGAVSDERKAEIGEEVKARIQKQRILPSTREQMIEDYTATRRPEYQGERIITEEEAMRPFLQERPEGESEASYQQRREMAMASVTSVPSLQPDIRKEAEAIFPEFGGGGTTSRVSATGVRMIEEEEPEPVPVPDVPQPPRVSGITRRRRRAIT